MEDVLHSKPIFISEEEVKSVISWPLVTEAVEEALRAVCRSEPTENFPFSSQPPRSFTFVQENQESSVLLTMPGYVGNYSLNGNSRSTLACKVVTSFNKNEARLPPLPNILANILLFNTSTGRLKCVMAGNEITGMRTAAASLVATKYLYFWRPPHLETGGDSVVLSILGCGVQGRIHAIGFASFFAKITEIRLWNKTIPKAHALAIELEELRAKFLNQNIRIVVSQTVEECVNGADIIVTATFASQPFLYPYMVKPTAHINAIGAGVNHHCELSEDLYLSSSVYIDNWGSAQTELKDLKADIVGELGQVIDGMKPVKKGITVFQSMGMASEDATVAAAVYEALVKKSNV